MAVFETLRRFPAPGAAGIHPVDTGDKSFASPVGYVEHVVHHHDLTVLNITLPLQHVLYYGEVLRKVQVSGGTIYIRTEGTGVGAFASLNELFSGPLWTSVDQNIINEFR